MDPTATYHAMAAAWASMEYTEAMEHAENLKNWLDNGGFYPTYDSVSLEIPKQVVNSHIRQILRDGPEKLAFAKYAASGGYLD